jgi:4-alpha-glucanotransferase
MPPSTQRLRPSLDERASGLLLHPTSLPGVHGSGDLGGEARSFVDFLESAGQRWWQMLPVGPPGYGESPYSAQSAFAGNPMLVDPEQLVERGWIDRREVAPRRALASQAIEYVPMEAHRMRILRAAFEGAKGRLARGGDAEYRSFATRAAPWLDDFALFRALKREHGGAPWTRWAPALAGREPEALAAARERCAGEIEFERFVQYAFDLQWRALREYAAARGVGLIGDIPIFVAHDSADVWAHPDLFALDERGEPVAVAGVPPDYFSATGQRWGNPLYRWKRMRRGGYRWWEDRLRTLLDRFDAIRVDHFIGFQRYWRIPADEPTAVRGRWMKGPGAHFFATMKRKLGRLPLIAEDLGAVTPAVFALRDRFEFPGIKILQFAFGKDPYAYTFLPHNYVRRAVVFTGTHDNDTTVGWFRDEGGGWSTRSPAEAEAERTAALRYLGTTGDEIHWDMIRTAFASVANLAIVPVQDVLGLGSQARMNRPGDPTGNWLWRFEGGALTPIHAERLALMTATYGRGREGHA